MLPRRARPDLAFDGTPPSRVLESHGTPPSRVLESQRTPPSRVLESHFRVRGARARMLEARAGWPYQLLRAAEQSLDDLARSGACEVVFVRHPRQSEASSWLDNLEDKARAF